MSEFEYVILCLLIPLVYVLAYIAGKYDILTVICKMLEEYAKGGVVRCSECKFCVDNDCIYPKNDVIEKVPEIGRYYRIQVRPKVKEDHFCGYGERREEK